MLCRIYPYLLRLICWHWGIETTNPKGQINHMTLRLISIANNKKQRKEECMSKGDYSTVLIAVKEHSLDSRNLSSVFLYHCCLVQVHINPKRFLPQIDPCSWEWLVLLFGISGIPFSAVWPFVSTNQVEVSPQWFCDPSQKTNVLGISQNKTNSTFYPIPKHECSEISRSILRLPISWLLTSPWHRQP